MLLAQTIHSPQPLITGAPQAPGVLAWLSDCESRTDSHSHSSGWGPCTWLLCPEPSLGPTHVMALNTPLPHGLSPCAQLSSCFPQGIRVRAVAPLSGEQTGGGGNGGEPWKEVETPSGPESRSPCRELPRVWTAGWDAHRRLHADSRSALSITNCEGPTTCSPVPWSTDLPHTDVPARLRHLLTDRVGAPGSDFLSGSEKTIFPSVSLAENPSLENLSHPDVYSLKIWKLSSY